MKIELILLGVIGAVFLADFLIKGVKKKKVASELEIIGKKKNNNKKLGISYLLRRKKNISLLIIFIPFFKDLLHYILYPIMTRDCITCSGRRRDITYTAKYRDSFGEHFDKIIEDELWLFIPAIIAPLFIIWFFNDKIKAR